jgi:hypothetical protein
MPQKKYSLFLNNFVPVGTDISVAGAKARQQINKSTGEIISRREFVRRAEKIPLPVVAQKSKGKKSEKSKSATKEWTRDQRSGKRIKLATRMLGREPKTQAELKKVFESSLFKTNWVKYEKSHHIPAVSISKKYNLEVSERTNERIMYHMREFEGYSDMTDEEIKGTDEYKKYESGKSIPPGYDSLEEYFDYDEGEDFDPDWIET